MGYKRETFHCQMSFALEELQEHSAKFVYAVFFHNKSSIQTLYYSAAFI